MSLTPEISLAFTFYNEEKNCRQILPPIKEALERAGISFQMILVNNGSVDQTGEILEQMAREDLRLVVAHVKVNEGYGGGILEGLRHATGKFVGYLSGDGQVAPEDVLNTLKAIREDRYDLVKVRRVTREDGWIRLFVSRGYNLMMRFLFRCPTGDLNGTPKIFPRKLLPILDLRSKDWFIDPELMIKSARLGLRLYEIPITFYPRKEGKSSVHFGTIFEFFKNAILFPLRKDYRQWKKQKLSSWRVA